MINFSSYQENKTNMGYDDGECVQCCFLNGDNIGTSRRGDLCLKCLHECSSSKRVDSRLGEVLRERMGYGTSTCYHCDETCSMWVNVSVCDDHAPKARPNYLSMLEDYRESDVSDIVDERIRDDAFKAGILVGIAEGWIKPKGAEHYNFDCEIFRPDAGTCEFSFEELKYVVLSLFWGDLPRKTFEMEIDEKNERIYVTTPDLTNTLCFTKTSVGYEDQFSF